MTKPLLPEGDLDRGRLPDFGSEHFRCGIVDPATGALPRAEMKIKNHLRYSREMPLPR
jgi:hypothetical protein